MATLKTGQKIYIIYDDLEIEEAKIIRPANVVYECHEIKKRHQRGVDFIHEGHEGKLFFLTLEEAKNKLSRNKAKLIKDIQIYIESLECKLNSFKNKLKTLEEENV